MLKNILSSIGIGGASVDTVVENPGVVVGERLHCEIRIKGASAGQDIRGIVLELVTRCLVDAGGDEPVYSDIVVGSAAVDPGPLLSGENGALQVAIDVPLSTPLSIGSTSTTLRTRLDIARAIDARDSDRVRILPNRAMEAVFEGMEQAGFRLAETEVEYSPHRQNPFVQEFDFRPASFSDFGVEEVEIAFTPFAGGVEVMLTVDNRGGFFTAGRERSARFRATDADAARGDMAAELRHAIQSLRS